MDGIYLIVMEDSEKTQIVRAQKVMDGGMVEFRDAVTDTFIGCCGINFWRKNSVRFDDNLDLPPWPAIR